MNLFTHIGIALTAIALAAAVAVEVVAPHTAVDLQFSQAPR